MEILYQSSKVCKLIIIEFQTNITLGIGPFHTFARCLRACTPCFQVPCCQSRGLLGLELVPRRMDLHPLLNLSSLEQEGLALDPPALVEPWLGVVQGPLVPPHSPQWQTT